MALGDEMLVARAGPADPLPVPLCPDPDPVEVKIKGTDVAAVDPTDPAGYELVELAGQIASRKRCCHRRRTRTRRRQRFARARHTAQQVGEPWVSCC